MLAQKSDRKNPGNHICLKRSSFGSRALDKAEAARRLKLLAKVGRIAAYDALKLIGGRHSKILRQRDNGKIGLAFQ